MPGAAMAVQAGGSAPSYSPHVVGGAFVKQYYETLRSNQKDAYKFYNGSSILGRSDSNGNMKSVTTIHDINEQLLSTDFTDYLIELETVDSQSSHVDGVLILVTGSLTPPSAVKQKFTQSFFLAPQANGGYFVLNDMFRFVSGRPSSEINEAVANCDNASTQSTNLLAETETASIKESTIPDIPPTEKMPIDEVMNPSTNGVSPVKNDSGANPCVKAVNDNVEKIGEAVPTPASAEIPGTTPTPASAEIPASAGKEVITKMTYASIVKTKRETAPAAPAVKPKSNPRPLAAQNAEKSPSSPPKPAQATNTAPAGDKKVSKNKSLDEPGYSVFVKNLPFDATVEMVAQEFKKFGAIKPGGIQVRNHQLDRFCYGFVEFESLQSMQAAIEASHVYFGSRQSYVEEKRTTTRVIDGVVTRGNDNGNGGGGRFQLGRGGYHGNNFRGQGFRNNGNYRDGDNRRNDFGNRGRGQQGFPQRGSSYHQNGNGYHQNGNSYAQNGDGYQQRRPFYNGNGNANGGRVERNDDPRQTPVAA